MPKDDVTFHAGMKVNFESKAAEKSLVKLIQYIEQMDTAFAEATKDMTESMADMATDVADMADAVIGHYQEMATQKQKAAEKDSIESSRMVLAAEFLGQAWSVLGKIGDTALNGMISSSPLLRAEMAIMRADMLLLWMDMGDNLQPAFEAARLAVEGLIGVYMGLPEPVQEVISVTLALIPVILTAAGAVALLTWPIVLATLAVIGIALALALLYVAFKENFLGIADTVMDVWNLLKDTFMEAFDQFSGGSEGLGDDLETVWKGADRVFRAIIDILAVYFVPALTTVVSMIGGLLGVIVQTFRNIVGFISAIIRGDFREAMGYFVAIVMTPIDVLQVAIKAFFVFIETTFNAIGDLMITIFGEDSAVAGAFYWFGDLFESIGDNINDVIETLQESVISFVTNIDKTIADLWVGISSPIGTFFSDIFTSITAFLTGMLNSLIDVVNIIVIRPLNYVLNELEGIIDAIPGFSRPSFSIGEIQRFHSGGLVGGTGEQMIVAEAGELVIPKNIVRDLAAGGRSVQQASSGPSVVINFQGGMGKDAPTLERQARALVDLVASELDRRNLQRFKGT